MDPAFLEFLQEYRYWLLFVLVFAEQIGLPTPSTPFLMAAGAFIRSGNMSIAAAMGAAFSATLISDLIWYEIGRRRGARVLQVLCRISLEPDSCVSRTKGLFARHGARALLAAKFVPGLNTAAPPLSGVLGMSLSRFLVFDSLGALLWIGVFMGLGFVFGNQLQALIEWASQLGGWMALIMAVGLGAYLAFKFIQRRRFMRRLRIARVTPEQLKGWLDQGRDVFAVDLRHRVDFLSEPITVPGALHLPVEELDTRWMEIPQDREIILLCT